MKVDRSKLCQLRMLAEALNFKVVFRRVKAMRDCEDGLCCPDLYKIYIDPKANDVLYTLAHEIGHIFADHMCLSDEPEEYAERIADDFADLITSILRNQPMTLIYGLTRTFGGD